MDKEYIELEAAKEAARRAECDANYDGAKFTAEWVENALDFTAARKVADVVEVRRGKWLAMEYVYGDPDVGTEDMWIDRLAEQSDYYAYCSICGKAAGYNGEGSLVLSDYCPHCGAKMTKA